MKIFPKIPMSIAAVVILALLVLPLFVDAESSYFIYLLFVIFIYVIMAQSWNLIAGYTGQMSLGTQAFFGLGAYGAALAWQFGIAGYMSIAGFIIAGMTAMVVALLVGAPLLSKLRGDYFTLGTLGLGEILKVCFIQGKTLTGGAIGVMLPSNMYDGMVRYYYWALVIMLICLVTIWLMVHSRIGLAMRSVREDEDAADANGVPILRIKLLAFAYGAFFIGIAGALQAYYMFHIHPYGMFSINWGLWPILMVILGGVGTFMGPIIGAVALAVIFEVSAYWAPELQTLLSGILIILVTLFMPRGVMYFITRDNSTPVAFAFIRRRLGFKDSAKTPGLRPRPDKAD